MYNYTAALITECMATVGLGLPCSTTFKNTRWGTLQGSIISPLPFNNAIKGFSQILQDILRLQLALYTDDLHVRTTTGSIGEKQDFLQAAFDKALGYL